MVYRIKFNDDIILWDKNTRTNLTIHFLETSQLTSFLNKFKLDITVKTIKTKKENKNEFDFDLIEIKNDGLLLDDKCITIEFQKCKEQIELFELIKNQYTIQTRSITLYERSDTNKELKTKKWITNGPLKHKYPIYVISKGRYTKGNRHTIDYLNRCNIDYFVVIEPDEYSQYLTFVSKEKILLLPQEYLNLNQGGIPSRQFVLSHSKANGDYRHWILDDNMDGFYYNYYNVCVPIDGEDAFRIVEEYTDRYTNIYLSGHNYKCFSIGSHTEKGCITTNTRVYSCILIRNDITDLKDKDGNLNWRNKYNEDTDLSLRVLKLGFPTFICNVINVDKKQSLSCKGGNTDTIYKGDFGVEKSKALLLLHPDVVKLTENKFNSNGKVLHHDVDYPKHFGNIKFIKKEITPVYISQIKLVDKVQPVVEEPVVIVKTRKEIIKQLELLNKKQLELLNELKNL